MEFGFLIGLAIGLPVGGTIGLIATYWWAKNRIIQAQAAVVNTVTTNSRQVAKNVLTSLASKKVKRDGLR